MSEPTVSSAGEGLVRVSLAASEESIAIGIDRLADALERTPKVAA